MKRLKLPLGIEFFDRIREDNDCYYVDKTELIVKLLEEKASVTLFTRPRRFGKTLTMSMLKCFFEVGADKTLFDGLAVSKEKELCERHMGRYPVISLTLKDVDGRNFDEAYQMLRKIIKKECLRFQFLTGSGLFTDEDMKPFVRILEEDDGPDDIKSSLHILSDLLYKYYGEKAIILIDEYDVPLDKANHFGYYKEMISVIRGLLAGALKSNESLQFAVLTGCLRVSKESIFTGLNNLVVHSIADAGFEEYFGFTQGEVDELLKYYGFEACREKVRQWYDGYNFAGTKIYCPWDVLNYCYALTNDPDKEPETYWINTSGNDLVRQLIDLADPSMQKEIERLIDGEEIEKKIHMELTYQDIGRSKENLWSVLFTTGYLTSGGKTPDGKFKLTIPNREVREVYILQIQEWFRETVEQTQPVRRMCQAILDRDAKGAQKELTAILGKTISILDTKARDEQKENFYHGLLIGLLRSRGDWAVSSNVESGDGFCDIIIEPEDPDEGFVIEVKYADSFAALDKACEAAMRQIKEKRYGESLRYDGRLKVGAYGIAFFKKRCRVVFEELKE